MLFALAVRETWHKGQDADRKYEYFLFYVIDLGDD